MLTLFLTTIVATLYLLVLGVWRAARPLMGRFLAVVVIWMTLTAVLAQNGLFAQFERRPPPLAILLGVMLIGTTAAAFSRFGKQLAEGLPLAWLVGFHAFRLPVEIFLHTGYLAGVVPRQMTWEGRNLDVLTGISAILVAWLLAKSKLNRETVKLWNWAGFLLLLNIMIIAVLSLPGPFRQFLNERPNQFVAEPPYIWLPSVLVASAWFGHMLLFRRLSARMEQ
jgi:hypothetical protein